MRSGQRNLRQNPQRSSANQPGSAHHCWDAGSLGVARNMAGPPPASCLRCSNICRALVRIAAVISAAGSMSSGCCCQRCCASSCRKRRKPAGTKAGGQAGRFSGQRATLARAAQARVEPSGWARTSPRRSRAGCPQRGGPGSSGARSPASREAGGPSRLALLKAATTSSSTASSASWLLIRCAPTCSRGQRPGPAISPPLPAAWSSGGCAGQAVACHWGAAASGTGQP